MAIQSPVVLVIGTGQLGTELAARTTDAFRIVAVGRAKANITDDAEIAVLFSEVRPAIVLNTAAYTAVDRAEADQEAAFAVNRDGPAILATACAERDIPLIHVSTDYVFDGANGPYGEDDVPSPCSVYGASKLAGEEAVRARLQRHIILRTAWLFGAAGHNFVKTMLRLAGEGRDLRVVDDQQGCPTPAAALAESMLMIAKTAIEGRTIAWGTYHYAGQPPTTWFGFAEQIFRVSQAVGLVRGLPRLIPIKTADYPTAARRPANSSLTCDALSRLGLTPPDWRTGLERMLRQMPQPISSGSLS
jgi:dTDP-4-dehydrorhamnose reductase